MIYLGNPTIIFCSLNSLSQYDESVALRRTASGDEAAFGLLFQKYRDKVYYIAWRILKSETGAEDVLQDVFIKIWDNRQKLGMIVNFSAYLNTITRNHIYNHLRKIANEELFLSELVRASPDNSQSTFDAVVLHELQRNLQEAVAQLPPQQKKVFQLSRMQGLRQEEIADYMKISLGTVKKHMVVSLRFIKNYLSTEGKMTLLLLSLILRFH